MQSTNDSSCAAYPFSANHIERVCRRALRDWRHLKSSTMLPMPGIHASMRSPPDVLLPTVQYVRLATEPSANSMFATTLCSPIGSAFPDGSDVALTQMGSDSSIQYIRSTKWHPSPRIAPPCAASAAQ